MPRRLTLIAVPALALALSAPAFADDAPQGGGRSQQRAAEEAERKPSILGSFLKQAVVGAAVGVATDKIAEEVPSEAAGAVGALPGVVSAISQPDSVAPNRSHLSGLPGLPF